MENKQSNNLNNYYDDLNDDNYEQILKTIYNSKIKNEVDITKSIFDDEKKRLSNDLTAKMSLEYLKIEDRNYDDIFIIQEKYLKTLKKWTNGQNTSKIFKQLSDCNIYDSIKIQMNSSVGPLSSIETMVESTYGFSNDFKYNIAEEICYVKLLSSKWRSIKGDGNCYYRSVIFNYLENLIVERDITNLQRIAIDFDEKFDEGFVNTKRLSFDSKNSVVQLDKRLILTIFKIIIVILENTNKNESVRAALLILAKAFNFSTTFDTAMIMYLRYILYEYIHDNKEKFFSEDFAVKIGNLLPYQYETEKGDFLYDKFFEEELLKFYTYAEKIAIYLTPFVLKVDLNVIFYDYGKEANIQTKSFSCYLKDKPTITILYRKAHYDVAYQNEKFNNLLCYFVNKEDKLKVVDQILIDYYQRNEMQKVNLKESKIFNKKEKLLKLKDDNRKTEDSTRSTALETTLATNISQDSKDVAVSSDININSFEIIDAITDDDLRIQLCIECLEEIPGQELKSYKLPCGCYLYGKECIEKYSKFLYDCFKINEKESKIVIHYCIDRFKMLLLLI